MGVIKCDSSYIFRTILSYIFRLVSEVEELVSCTHSASGAYNNVCVELETDAVAVCALLQAHTILQLEGTSMATSFTAQQTSIQDVMANTGRLKTPLIIIPY